VEGELTPNRKAKRIADVGDCYIKIRDLDRNRHMFLLGQNEEVCILLKFLNKETSLLEMTTQYMNLEIEHSQSLKKRSRTLEQKEQKAQKEEVHN